MEMLLYIVGLVILVVGLIFGYNKLKSKGVIGNKELSQSKLVLHVVKELVNNFDFDNKKVVKKIVSSAYVAVKYVEQSAKYENNEEKYLLAEDAVYAMLNEMEIEVTKDREMEIEVTKDRKEIVKVAIELIVSFLPPTYSDGQKKKKEQSDEFVDNLKGVIDNVSTKQ